MLIQKLANTPIICRQSLEMYLPVTAFSGIQEDTFTKCANPDLDLQLLDLLARKYKSTPSKENKINLLNKEEEILWQDFLSPEKYLYRDIKRNPEDYKDLSPQEQKNKFLKKSAYGLMNQFQVKSDLGYKIEKADFYFTELEKIYNNSKKGSIESINSFVLMNNIYQNLNSENKIKSEKIAYNILLNSEIVHKQRAVEFFVEKVDKSSPIIEKVREFACREINPPINSAKREKLAIVLLGKLKSPELTEIIPKILTNSDPELKKAAIWAAGMVKTEDNYQVLLNTLKGKMSEDQNTDLKIKEMTVSSISEYYNEMPDEVTGILEGIIKAGTPLSEFAAVYLERASGKDKKKDYFINKENLTPAEIKQYKIKRDKLVQDIKNLKPEELNKIDQAMLPFRKALAGLIVLGVKIYFTDETITEKFQEYIGERNKDGRFDDTITALTNPFKTVQTRTVLDKIYQIPAHEFAHMLHFRILDREDKNKLESLYNNAKDKKAFLDEYSSRNVMEYFAQANEAYVSVYKPHVKMIDIGTYYKSDSNTRLYLMDKDLDLYNFVEHCIKKYGNPSKEVDSPRLVSV